MSSGNPRIAILGLGGVGGSLAALFCRAGAHVTGLVRNEKVQGLHASGVRLLRRGYEAFTVYPAISSILSQPVDFLIIAIKAPDLGCAMERVPQNFVEQAIILPLLNGLDHMRVLRHYLGDRVVPGSVSVVATREGAGVFRVDSSFYEVTTAPSSSVPLAALSRWVDFMRNAGVTVQVKANEAEVLWGKLARLSALACLTAYTNLPIGALRQDPVWRPILIDFLRETAEIAAAEGAPTDPNYHLKLLDALNHDATSSLQRDIAAGHPSELDAIGGAVIRAAERHGVACPTVRKIVCAIQRGVRLNKGGSLEVV